MRTRVFVRTILILLRRAIGWLKTGLRNFWQRPFFGRTPPSVEFIGGWRWYIYPDKNIVKLQSNSENPDFYYNIEDFRNFISKCRNSLELKNRTPIKLIEIDGGENGLISIHVDENHVVCEIRDSFLWIAFYEKRRMETSTFKWLLKTLEDMLNSEYQVPPGR